MNKDMQYTFAALCTTLLLALSAGPVLAQPAEVERRITSTEALGIAMRRNPDLKAARVELERSAQDVKAEEGLYPFILQLDGGYTHNSSPSLSSGGGVAHRTSDTIATGASLSKSLPVGTSASLSVDGSRIASAGPSWDPSGTQKLGPSYGLTTQLSVTQPLLRGFGDEIGEASLRQAVKAEKLADLRARRSTSELVEQVLTTYWNLWYAERALQIDIKARELAQVQSEEVDARVQAGSAAPVDLLPFQTRLASLDESIVAAKAERIRLSVELGRLVGAPELGGRLMADDSEQPPLPPTDPPVDSSVKAAVNHSPEVLEQAASLVLSREKALVTADELRPRLDLQGWVRAQTMGDDEIAPVLEQFDQEEAYSAYLGLLYELPLDDTRRRSRRAAAGLEVESSEQKLVAARNRVAAAVRSAVERQLSARERIRLAEQTLAAAEKQAAAERERQQFGAAIYVQVREAEEAVRAAGLRVERARIDLVQADIALRGLTGELAAVFGS